MSFTYEPDGLGRREKVTDLRIGSPAVIGYNDRGQMISVRDPSEKKTVNYSYDPDSGLKTEEKTETLSGDDPIITRYAYNTRDQVTHGAMPDILSDIFTMISDA